MPTKTKFPRQDAVNEAGEESFPASDPPSWTLGRSQHREERAGVFDAHPERYERWFEAHRDAYVSELLALRHFVPWAGRGLEIGVGTGRFAAPLGVEVGIDPSEAMLSRARGRGVEVVKGVGEELPFEDGAFEHALIVTTLCLVDDPAKVLAEAHRVLAPAGRLVIGFIDRDSAIGEAYAERSEESMFYRDARFLSVKEVSDLLHEAGFIPRAWGQTLSRALPEVKGIEPVRPGTGRGGFVIVGADRHE